MLCAAQSHLENLGEVQSAAACALRDLLTAAKAVGDD
jgi:hypothetical protein